MLSFNKFSLFVFIVLYSFANFAFAQNVYSNENEKYSQVRIFATSPSDFQKIQNAGLFFDGGIHKPGLYFETWLSESEIAMLKNSGVSYQVTIDDWMQYYNNVHKNSGTPPQLLNTDAFTISHNIIGTMGGHLKWEEALAKLDSMRLQYPTLVSVKFSYGNSYENRPLWTIRVTKNPDAPTGRPEIWLNGVTHAREPMGMMNVFYYIYWLLENYNIDPLATYILNNREIYFTPFINPDGYYYNQTTNPNGGGMWRKNRQPYGGSTGTDCNRNFGTYNFWNSSNNGSSATPSNDTYRGPYPFSTPEDSAFRVFVNSRNFKTELDYHTYGDYLIKPWAWCDPTPTPDDAVFNENGNDVNNILPYEYFIFGTPYQTVAYYVRGGDLDWLYSTDTTGHANHIFAMTPEVGNASDNFWAPQNRIIPLSQSCMSLNIYASLSAGQYASLKYTTFNKMTYTPGETGNLKVLYRNKGRADAQNIKIQITPVTNYISFPVSVYTKASLSVFALDSTTFNFNIASNCPNNMALKARLKIMQNDTVVMNDKIIDILVGAGNPYLIDSAENGTTNWPTMTNWSVVTNKYLSPTHSFKGACTNNGTNQMVSNPINVSSYPAVFLSFYQKFALETGYDFGFVDLSSNNGTSWQRIARFTGVDSSTWKLQSYNITSYANGSTNMLIRFRDSCDAGANWDGWYIDNIRITGYNPGPTIIIQGNNYTIPEKFSLEQNYPNPFNPTTQINYSIAKEGFVKISIFDVLGREVKVLVNEVKTPGFYAVDFDGTNLSSGMYFYRMESGNFVDTKKMTLIK
jgi:carboxypeptidase T